MKFSTRKHLNELVRIDKYLEKNPDCPILHNRRRFVYLVNEAHDRSFITSGAAVKLHNNWYIWPAGLEAYVELQIQRTLRQHAAA